MMRSPLLLTATLLLPALARAAGCAATNDTTLHAKLPGTVPPAKGCSPPVAGVCGKGYKHDKCGAPMGVCCDITIGDVWNGAKATCPCVGGTPKGGPLVSNTLGSNMVLQRGRPAPIWGWAAPAASVSVAFDGATLSAKAGADGLWRVALPAQPATLAPRTIVVKSGSEPPVALTNVLFGDVILCSGQSK